MQIHLSDLPDEFIIKLDGKSRLKLFGAIKSSEAPIIGVSRSFFYHLKNNRHGFRLSLLRKFAIFARISLDQFEPHVTEILSNRGGRISVNLPIGVSVYLASLIGHSFGDGNISYKKAEFDYVNKDKKLIEIVISDVEKLFGSTPTYYGSNGDGTFKATFSNLVGKILELAGAPRGSKVHSTCSVPDWIMNGSADIKKAYLRALFDDDGSVLYSKGYNAKNVSLHFTRDYANDYFFLNFLNDLRFLLLSLEIISSKPYVARTYKVDSSKRIVRGILVNRKKDLMRFYSEINFIQFNKKNRLEKIVMTG